MKIQVIACDVDQQVPALTYTITVSDGRTISKDLCEEHAGYLEDLLEEAEVSEDEPEAKPEPAPKPAAKRAPAKKAPAKEAAAKVPARRRAKVVSFEEIEARKSN
jgi:topoisomerase IA-like protein